MSKKSVGQLLLILLVLDMALAVVVVWCVLQVNMPQRRDQLAERAGVNAETPSELAAEKVALLTTEAMSHVSMTGEIHVKGGRATLLLENDIQGDCALRLTLLTERGDALLSTGLIDPGYWVEEITFTQDLQAGEYTCLAEFDFYELTTGLNLGQIGRYILLIVED